MTLNFCFANFIPVHNSIQNSIRNPLDFMNESIINIDHNSKIPKYEQLIRSIQNAIKNGDLRRGDLLPSINSIAENHPIARDTVIKAFHSLKNRGIITSVPGKGYFVYQTQFQNKHNVFLLFDNFYSYKEALYNSFKTTMGENAIIDIYFHHSNPILYKTLIQNALDMYTEYVIMPMLDKEHLHWLTNTIGNRKTYILDIGCILYGKRFPSVCQNFQKQWYEALKSANSLIKNYDNLVLVLWRKAVNSNNKVNTFEMRKGFEQYCQEENVPHKIVEKESEIEIHKKTCYIIPDNEDLVYFINFAQKNSLKLGHDIGLISHNDEPLKAVVANVGIATITTDFVKMGQNMAEMIMESSIKHIENPSSLIIRGSL